MVNSARATFPMVTLFALFFFSHVSCSSEVSQLAHQLVKASINLRRAPDCSDLLDQYLTIRDSVLNATNNKIHTPVQQSRRRSRHGLNLLDSLDSVDVNNPLQVHSLLSLIQSTLRYGDSSDWQLLRMLLSAVGGQFV